MGDVWLTVDRSGKKATRAKLSPAHPSVNEPAGANPLVSNALRTAYEEAVKEDVPAEFLDLLNKLS